MTDLTPSQAQRLDAVLTSRPGDPIDFVRDSVEYYTAEVKTLHAIHENARTNLERDYWRNRLDFAARTLEQYLSELVALTKAGNAH